MMHGRPSFGPRHSALTSYIAVLLWKVEQESGGFPKLDIQERQQELVASQEKALAAFALYPFVEGELWREPQPSTTLMP